MSVTFGGIGSGLPVNDIIDATIEAKSYRLYKYQEQQDLFKKQKSAYSTVEAKYNSLKSNLESLIDSKLVYAFDLFNRKKTDVSDSNVATVTTHKGAESGSIEMDVKSLVQNPTLSKSDFAGSVTGSAKLSDLGVIDGTFSVAFEDTINAKGLLLDVEVDPEDTIDGFIEDINTALSENEDLSGTVSGTIDSTGKLSLDFSSVATGGIQLDEDNPVGNSTSNFADVFGFSATGNVLNGESKSSLNLDGTLYGNNANIRGWSSDSNIPETINIGGLEVEINETLTLRQLMNKVNESDECQVKMKYDQSTNSMVFEGNDDYYSDYIYFSGDAFLNDIGATVNGSTNVAAQTPRQPGEVVINGTTIYTKSNKLTPAETGIQGVTINLKSTTKADESLDINISDNTEDLEKTVNDVIGAYNSIVDTVKKYTFANVEEENYGVLRTEYAVIRMQNELKSIMLSGVEDDLKFKALSLVGISSADDDSGHLDFDKAEFIEALEDNPDDLKALLIGTQDGSVEGVFEKVKNKLDIYLDVENGYFETKEDSITRTISDLNKSISKEEERLEMIKKRLTEQYATLDKTMSTYNSQMSSLSGML